MPLGTSSGYNSGPLVLLNPRTKTPDGKKAKPHFTADRPGEGGELVRDEQTYTEISGDLFRAETKSRTFLNSKTNKEQTVTDWVLYLRDSEAGYRLPLNQNGASRDLLNRFARLVDTGDFSNLTLSYYENKRGRDAYSLKQNGQRVEWKYTLDELPQPREIKDPETNEVIKRDYSKLDAFFTDVVAQIAAALGQQSNAPAASQATEQTDQSGEQAGDDQAGADQQVADEAGDQSAVGEETNVEPPADEAPLPAPTKTVNSAPRPAAKPVAQAPAPKPAAAPAKPAPAPAPKPAPAAATRPAPKTAPAGATTSTKRNVPF